MEIIMVIYDIKTNNMDYVKVTDFENSLSIYTDKNNNYFFNLNSTIYLNISNEYLLTYVCDFELQWPLISYKLYGTTRLAWLLMKINNINIKDVFKTIPIGTKVKYLNQEKVSSLIADINNFDV